VNIFIAGGSGAIGMRLVRQLVAQGHEVTAMTRTAEKADALRALGARPALADALERTAVLQALGQAEPEVVIHQLTSLAGVDSFKNFDEEFALTNRLRTVGTGYLLEGARAAGARRFIAQSYGNWNYERSGARLKVEEDRLDPHPPANQRQSLAAIEHLESAVTNTEEIEGIALRYGNFYGPGTGLALDGDIVRQVLGRRLPIVGNGAGVWSFVHVDDAAAAALAAVERGSRGIYNVADDQPAPVAEWLPGGQAPEDRSGLAGTAGGGRGRRVDDDPDPRRVEREGQARARLDAAVPDLPRGFP
jgi:nucleoside-diphosphate-sugar epimerase